MHEAVLRQRNGAVEIDPVVAEWARGALVTAGYREVTVVNGDGEHGCPWRAPFDRVIVTAGRAWRRAWARVGVRCDGVSSRVLVLNLPLHGDVPAARWSAAAPGEPLWLTLRSLSGAWSAPAKATIFVCENVTVLEAAADRLSTGCPPMVCTDGNPANVALDLIAGLSAAACTIRVRADFDPAGLAIVDQVRSVAPAATGWRYDAATYAAQLGVGYPLSAELVDEWRGLRTLYECHRISVHEEAILDDLIEDLAHVVAGS